IFGYYTSSSNHAAITNAYSGANHRTAANPHIFTNLNRFGKFNPRSTLFIIEWMGGGIDLHIGTNEGPAPNYHFHNIENHTIEVEEHFFTQHNIIAVITIKRRL